MNKTKDEAYNLIYI